MEMMKNGVCLFALNDDDRRVTWELNNYCNLNCIYCCNSAKKHLESRAWTEKHYSKVIDRLEEERVNKVYLTGGEPFCQPEILRIIGLLCNFAEVTIATNGTLVTNKDLGNLLAFKDRLSFHVSLDGYVADENDYLRGRKGSFKETVAAIRNIVRHGFKVRIGLLVHSYNYANLIRMPDLCHELGCKELVLSWPINTGRADIGTTISLPVTRDEFVSDYANQIRMQREDIKVTIKRESFDGKLLEKYNCPGGEKLFHIDASGKVWPCSWIAKIEKNYQGVNYLLERGVKVFERSNFSDFAQLKIQRSKFGVGCLVACLINNSTYMCADPMVADNKNRVI